MKIAVSGKGGSGKTTLAGNLAREFARRGHRVLAVDADPNPNLAATLGLAEADQLRFLAPGLAEQVIETALPDGGRSERLPLPAQALLERYGIAAPDGVSLLTVGTVEHAGSGCNCSFHSVVRGTLGELTEQPGWVSIVDMEAGLEHLKRGTVKTADALLLVIEPYYRSLETGARLQRLASELGVPHIYAVGNKVRSPDDAAALADFCRRHPLDLIAMIPYDEAFLNADRQRQSALAMPGAANSPGLAAIRDLAGALEARFAA